MFLPLTANLLKIQRSTILWTLFANLQEFKLLRESIRSIMFLQLRDLHLRHRPLLPLPLLPVRLQDWI